MGRRGSGPWLIAISSLTACGASPAVDDGDVGFETTSGGDEPWTGALPCGDGSGFSDDVRTYTLPSTAITTVADGGDVIQWATIDLDGDGLLDLVSIGPPEVFEDQGGQWIGLWQWRNTGQDFESEATTWSLPSSMISFGPIEPQGPNTSRLVDMDGDGRLDFLSAYGGSSGDDPTWLVYFNSGTAFGDVPTVWSVPFETDGVYDAGVVVEWRVLDLDGNGLVDMLARRGDQADGVSAWSWWPSTGLGFSYFERPWRIPFALPGVANVEDAPDWRVLDIDGDGRSDLLTLGSDGDAAAEQTTWSLYRGTGEGFATAALPFVVPVSAPHLVDDRLVPRWRLDDLDGDGRFDLIVAPDEPSEKWRVYFGVADEQGRPALAPTALDWTVPRVLDGVVDPAPFVRWDLIDLDGDGIRDLVIAEAAAPGTWSVYPGRCRPE